MKKIIHYCFLPILYFCFIAVLIVFRIQFVASVWEGYRILAVPVNVSEKNVLEKLKSKGINDIISISSVSLYQKNKIVPVTNFELSYKESIKKYFFDEQQQYSLFYLKESANLSTSLKLLIKETGSSWRIERISFFAILILIFPFGFSIIFFVLSKRKLLYFAMQLPFLVLCCGSTEFPATLCASIFPVVAYTIQHYWQRPGWVHFLIGDFVTVTLVLVMLSVLILAVPFEKDIRIAFLGLSAFLASSCAICFFHFFSKNKKQKGFVLINSAQTVSFSQKSKIELMLFAVLTFIVLGLSFAAKDRFFSSGGLKGLSLPVPHEFTKNHGFSYSAYETLVTSETQVRTLPDLADFVILNWKTDVLPYVSLNGNFPPAYVGSEVSMPVYEYDEESGRVSTERKILYTFDESYFTSVISKIASKQVPSVEKLLFAQKHFVTVAYKQFR
ncbi:MAG: hypothetical protein GX297_06845 [Treponema sp.]|nr:hypothetical protein [Treponema sp.]